MSEMMFDELYIYLIGLGYFCLDGPSCLKKIICPPFHGRFGLITRETFCWVFISKCCVLDNIAARLDGRRVEHLVGRSMIFYYS